MDKFPHDHACFEVGQLLKRLRADPWFKDFQRTFHKATGFAVELAPASVDCNSTGSPVRVNALIIGRLVLQPPQRIGKQLSETIAKRQATRAIASLLRFFGPSLETVAIRVLFQDHPMERPEIAKACQFIQQQFRRTLRLAEVAKEVAMRPGSFCRAFRHAMGMRFRSYVACLRVESAKSFLLDRQRKIIDIGFDSGFESLTHFNRTFKKIAGCSPTEYRKRLLRMGPKTHFGSPPGSVALVRNGLRTMAWPPLLRKFVQTN